MRLPSWTPAAMTALTMLSLSPPAAAADVPQRCEAVFQGPIKGCELLGVWTVGAAARSEPAARRVATDRLATLMAAVAEERALKAPGTPAADTAAVMVKSCPAAVAASARVVCYPEPQLAEDHICFAQLRSPECYRGSSLDVQGVGWKAIEKGREAICAAVDAGLSEQRATPAARAACTAECLQRAEVRCTPSGAGR